MKRLFALLLGAAFVGPAAAADMYYKAQPLPVAPPSGVWLGAGVAGAVTNSSVNDVTIPGQGSFYPTGAVPTISAGYDIWSGSMRGGVRLDYGYDLSRAGIPVAVPGLGSGFEKNGSLFRERFTFGITPQAIPLPSNLSTSTITPYITAGAVEAQRGNCVAIGGGSWCGSRWDVGYTVGGGFDIPIAQGWAINIELLRDQFNKSFTPSNAPSITFNTYGTWTGMAEVKYKF